MDMTQKVLQTLANKVGKLEVENTCLQAELQVLQQQIADFKQETELREAVEKE